MFMGTLTAMGMGNKNKMEPIIQEEVLEFCTLLKDKMQGPSEVTVVCIYFLFIPPRVFGAVICEHNS